MTKIAVGVLVVLWMATMVSRRTRGPGVAVWSEPLAPGSAAALGGRGPVLARSGGVVGEADLDAGRLVIRLPVALVLLTIGLVVLPVVALADGQDGWQLYLFAPVMAALQVVVVAKFALPALRRSVQRLVLGEFEPGEE